MFHSVGDAQTGRRDFENFQGGRLLKVALMGTSGSLLEEAMKATAVPEGTDTETDPNETSEVDETPARKRPAAASSSTKGPATKKKKTPPTPPGNLGNYK